MEEKVPTMEEIRGQRGEQSVEESKGTTEEEGYCKARQ